MSSRDLESFVTIADRTQQAAINRKQQAEKQDQEEQQKQAPVSRLTEARNVQTELNCLFK
jgi:hypothetical protein